MRTTQQQQHQQHQRQQHQHKLHSAFTNKQTNCEWKWNDWSKSTGWKRPMLNKTPSIQKATKHPTGTKATYKSSHANTHFYHANDLDVVRICCCQNTLTYTHTHTQQSNTHNATPTPKSYQHSKHMLLSYNFCVSLVSFVGRTYVRMCTVPS